MNIVNMIKQQLGYRDPNGTGLIVGTVLTSALIILGVEYLKKP